MPVGCNGTSRDFPNFDSRISSTPWAQSTSVRSSLIASPIRSPLAVSNPISVSYVAARNGDMIVWRAWPMSASTSVVE